MTLAERLRRALAAGHDRPVELLLGDVHDDEVDPAAAITPAAVLVAVTDRPRPGVILTERAASLRRHAGQIAFPGGRIDPGDADAPAAALREAHEEIGLAPAAVELVGEGDRYRTVSGFEVTPVIGVIAPDLPIVPSAGEVADWFEMPLDVLLDPRNHAEQAIEWGGRIRHIHAIDWEGRRIWGATAAITVNLARRLAWAG